MKKYLLLLINSALILVLFAGCSSRSPATSSDSPASGSSPATPSAGPASDSSPASVNPTRSTAITQKPDMPNYRQEMRDFVQDISAYMRTLKPGFAVVPQNGEELVSDGSRLYQDYLNAIDGIGREDFLYGYNQDNVATPRMDRDYMLSFLKIYMAEGKRILITDYCSSTGKVQDSYASSQGYGFISFAADQRELNNIPVFPQPVFSENAYDVSSLTDARNFLYLINPGQFSSKRSFIEAVSQTNYDLVILDLFFDDSQLTASDLAKIKIKANGAARLALCYLSIGEAEVYRYYWNPAWNKNPPSWLDRENPNWAGNYQVKYWDADWQRIIFGNSQSYAGRILDAGFDGVYLDLIDAYEYYERNAGK